MKGYFAEQPALEVALGGAVGQLLLNHVLV